MSKITVVGAGAVGATCADVLARQQVCNEVVLLDVKEGVSEGKALDLFQCSSILGFDTILTGSTNDYAKTAGSDVVVVTSGVPRKPGMTREELIGVNAGIVKTVVNNILAHSPNAVIIVVANPMDTMTYLTLKSTKLPKNRVIGMGGILDSARFKAYLALELKCNPKDLQATVIGGHGDTTMIPLTRFATVASMPVTKFIAPEKMSEIASATMVGGATLTKLLGTSAWYAPGAAAALLAESIVKDQKRVYPCSVFLEGEYGQNDICLGVPIRVGKSGIEEIIDLKLNEDESAAFAKSATAVRDMNNVLNTMNVF
ncbi:MAG: malate dehydrogenase [Bacteroidia bacterium]|nr:malate dehydrogenase [Bacteroidia bacterium]